MQSTGHSSMQALSRTSTHGSAITYVTSRPSYGAQSGGLRCDEPKAYFHYEIRRQGVRQMLGPEHVGLRVAVRIRLHDAAPGRRYRDVTGELIHWDTERLEVRSAAGTTVTVPIGDVAAARPIPPRPTPFSEILELERLLAAAWPPVEAEDLGGWLLRYSDGYTRRANSVLALTESDLSLDAAIAAVERWYAERGERPLIAVAPIAKRLDEELASRGWTDEARTAVLTKELGGDGYDGAARIVHRPSEDLLEQVGRGMPEVAAKILGSGPRRGFAEITEAGVLVARGRGAIEGDLVMISGIGTLPEYRRRGLGTEILHALESWGFRSGASRAALQVETDNEAALAMYGKLGYTERYRYWYRTPGTVRLGGRGLRRVRLLLPGGLGGLELAAVLVHAERHDDQVADEAGDHERGEEQHDLREDPVDAGVVDPGDDRVQQHRHQRRDHEDRQQLGHDLPPLTPHAPPDPGGDRHGGHRQVGDQPDELAGVGGGLGAVVQPPGDDPPDEVGRDQRQREAVDRGPVRHQKAIEEGHDEDSFWIEGCESCRFGLGRKYCHSDTATPAVPASSSAYPFRPLVITSEPAAVGADAKRTTTNQMAEVSTAAQRPPVHHTPSPARPQLRAKASAPASGTATVPR
ncbi:GNAT family N-acetyltransferase [Glycomyces buryatensis]|uniref:GNAT family N-acetyltransferase n=1 Tax=Glycomyces buryatensis TaxID=2570927 RepID=A0A4S8PVW7_9ACTN|nr:GNAT family N-acetyltransferase [Glycomyces buryatensis]